MREVIDINEYRESKSLEKYYLKFLASFNKLVPTPSNLDELFKCFYCVLRYLEGSVSCFKILTTLYGEDQITQELRVKLLDWLESIEDELVNS